MRKLSLLVASLFIILLASCNSVKTYTDYDTTTNFQTYSTFNFYQDMNTGFRPLNEKRFTQALVKTLREKQLTQSKTPDFKINFYTEQYLENNPYHVGIGVGTYSGHVGGNISTGIPLNHQEHWLRITLEFIDAQSNTLFWQTVIKAKFDPNTPPKKRKAYFLKLAEKALKNYPPAAQD